MEALAEELRRLKAGIAGMQGRLDFVLAEIAAELEHELRGTNAQPIGEVQLAVQDEVQLDAGLGVSLDPATPAAATEPPTAANVQASSDKTDIAAFVPGEPVAAAVPSFCNDQLPVVHDIDAAAVLVARPVETPRHIEAATAAMPADAGSLANLPGDATELTCHGVTSPAPTDLASNVIVLDEHCKTAKRKPGSAVLAAGRWAAAVALIALVGAVAVAGTGFATNFGELFKRKDGCAHAPPICTILPGIPL